MRGDLHSGHQEPGEVTTGAWQSSRQRHFHVLVFAQAERRHGRSTETLRPDAQGETGLVVSDWIRGRHGDTTSQTRLC